MDVGSMVRFKRRGLLADLFVERTTVPGTHYEQTSIFRRGEGHYPPRTVECGRCACSAKHRETVEEDGQVFACGLSASVSRPNGITTPTADEWCSLLTPQQRNNLKE
jgi:hypothetical protein